jgi:trehalose 6-phosphate synthase/phosphatase
MLRQRAEKLNIKITVGWFLHTPFPESEFFNVLPSKKEILDGILGADMVVSGPMKLAAISSPHAHRHCT